MKTLITIAAVCALFASQPAKACSPELPPPPPSPDAAVEQIAQWRADQEAERIRDAAEARRLEAEADRRLVASSEVAYVGRIISVRLHDSHSFYAPRTVLIARTSTALRGRPPQRFKLYFEPVPGVCGGVFPYTSFPEPKDVGREVLVLYGDTPSMRRYVHDLIFLEERKAARVLSLLRAEASGA